jgi:hypothetical protein
MALSWKLTPKPIFAILLIIYLKNKVSIKILNLSTNLFTQIEEE